jgi:hypothetical protein
MTVIFCGRHLILPLFVAAFVVLCQAAEAQENRVTPLSGRVIRSATGEPESAARVFLGRSQETRADAEGRFAFRAVSGGTYKLAAVGRGCFVAVGEVTVEAGSPGFVEFELIAPHLAPVPSTPMQWEDQSGLTGSPWKVITQEDLRTTGASDMLQVLQNAVPQMIGTGGGVSGRGGVRSMRGNNSAMGPNLPVVILDGIRVMGQPDIVLGNLDPTSVARVEIFRGPAGAWVHGSGSTGGVVRIFSKRFQVMIDPDTPPERCGNPLESGGS